MMSRPADTLIFSAHGVPQSVRKDAEARGLTVFDATCPLVTKVHMEVAKMRREGREIIHDRPPGHPEVEGTMGQISGPVLLVQSEKDVEALDIAVDHPVAYVTQTTLSVDDTKGIIQALHRRFTNIVGPETRDICYATQNWQIAVRELCKRADVILVVGAKNSSNSNRLREIGEEAKKPSYLVADGSELQAEWFDGVKIVGLTAGASAPEVLVEDVIAALKRFGPVEVESLDGAHRDVEFRLPPELADRRTGARAVKPEVKTAAGA